MDSACGPREIDYTPNLQYRQYFFLITIIQKYPTVFRNRQCKETTFFITRHIATEFLKSAIEVTQGS